MYFKISDCFGAGFGVGFAFESIVANTGDMEDSGAWGGGRAKDSTLGTGDTGTRGGAGSCAGVVHGNGTSCTGAGAATFFGISTCFHGCGEGAFGGGVGDRMMSAVDRWDSGVNGSIGLGALTGAITLVQSGTGEEIGFCGSEAGLVTQK